MYCPEDDDYAYCADCSSEVLICDRIYSMNDGRTLCFDCACERRGVYHEVLERWTVSPRLDDLRASPGHAG